MEILLGQDTAALLLNKQENHAPQPKDCPFYEDIGIHASPATNFLSIVGAIGKGTAVCEDSRNFKIQANRVKPLCSQMKDGNFIFHSNPKEDEIELINRFYKNCTYSVKRPVKKSSSLAIQHDSSKDPDPDGDDGHNGQDGHAPPVSTSESTTENLFWNI